MGIMGTELELKQTRRRRGNVLKLIRQGHEQQLERMTDSALQALLQDIGCNMSARQVMTMLQDLQEIGYLKFEADFDEEKERMVARHIMLTSLGAIVAMRRKDNENVAFS